MSINEYTRVMAALLDVNLRVKPGERVLVFTDLVRTDERIAGAELKRRRQLPLLARALADQARMKTEVLYHEYPAGKGHGAEPPESLWRIACGDDLINELQAAGIFSRLLEKNTAAADFKQAIESFRRKSASVVDCIVALSNFSTTHTHFCQLVTQGAQSRYASMPLFDESMFAGPLSVDPDKLAQFTHSVADVFNDAETASIETPDGTELSMSVAAAKVHADTGMLNFPQAVGNLPAGEVYLAPQGGTARGRMYIKYGPAGELASPLTLSIDNGLCVGIAGDDPYREILLAKFAETPLAANVAELGVGTNSRAVRPDNVLEAEKILGTVHVALGDNSTFGGAVSVPFHQDFVLFQPTLTLSYADGKSLRLLENGRMTIDNPIL